MNRTVFSVWLIVLCLIGLPVAHATLVSDNFNAYVAGVGLEDQTGSPWEDSGLVNDYFVPQSTGIPGSLAAEVDVAQNVTFGGYTHTTGFDPVLGDGREVRARLDFKLSLDDTPSNNRNTIVLGFSHTSANSGFLSSAQLQRTTTPNWRLKINSEPDAATIDSTQLGLASETSGSSNWLRLELLAAKTPVDDVFQMTASLYDLGATGLSEPSLIATKSYASIVDATLYDAANWYGYLLADRPDDIGLATLAYENFDVSFVPEPSSVVLMLMGAAWLVGWRRRRVASSATA